NRDFTTGKGFDDNYEVVRALFNNDGKMCASINYIPFLFRMNGETVKMAGIGGVVSLPEERNRGYIKKIMRFSLQEMRDCGQLFSFLYPFSNPYYRQFGYECCYKVQAVKIPLTAFAEFKAQGHAKAFVYEEDIETIKELYNSFVENKNLAIVRNELQWKEMFDRDAYKDLYYTYIWHNHEGKAVSYISFEALEGKENDIDVMELVWDSLEGLKGILGFLHKFYPYYSNFTGLLPEFIDFELLISEPFKVATEIKAKGMNRIVDVEKVLASLKYPEKSGQFTIRVNDDFCEWNTGTFWIAWENEKVEVVKKDLPADLTCGIQVLSQLVTGYASLEDLQEFAGVQVSGNATLLSAIFRKKQLFMRECF
ncbi:MAG: GNAT family N-acetyltransferase, partial [Eubacteriales bacterium]